MAATVVKEIRQGHFFLDVLAIANHFVTMPEKQTMTAPEVARACEVDQKSIWNWMRQGKAPRHTKTPGGMAKFQVAAVARWMSENKFRVPRELRKYLGKQHQIKEELLAAVEEMDHADRESLLAEYKRWLEMRRRPAVVACVAPYACPCWDCTRRDGVGR